ncbi:MAG: NAD(P)-binding protein [Mycobacterium sp.]|nr:NAD(P)-binding protein [Mycobacterium sp.]
MPAPRLWSSRPRPRPARFPPRVRPGAPRAAPAALVGPVRPVVVRVGPVRPVVVRVGPVRPVVVRVGPVRPVVVRVEPALPVVVRVVQVEPVAAVPVHPWQAAHPLRVEHLSVHRWRMPRGETSTDVVIVGAGPSGLAAAIRLKQRHPQLAVTVVVRAAELGGHILPAR